MGHPNHETPGLKMRATLVLLPGDGFGIVELWHLGLSTHYTKCKTKTIVARRCTTLGDIHFNSHTINASTHMAMETLRSTVFGVTVLSECSVCVSFVICSNAE